MNNTLTFRWFIKLVLMFLFCTMWHFLLPHTTNWPALCSYSLLLILNLKQTLESRLFIDSQSYQEKYGVETTDSTKYGQCNFPFFLGCVMIWASFWIITDSNIWFFFTVANPVGCRGAGPTVQRAAAEPAEQTWTSDRRQTHTVIEDKWTARRRDYFCTFCTTFST